MAKNGKMRAICIFVVLCLPVCGLAQGSSSSSGGYSTIGGSGAITGTGLGPLPGGRLVGTGNLQASLRADLQPLRRGSLTTSYRGHSISGTSYFTRTVMDSLKHEYFGYEVILEEQQPATYRATFGPLGATLMEMASMGARSKEWSIRTLALPESRIVHDGDVISIELMADAATGDKLIEDITVQPFGQRLPISGATGANSLAGQVGTRRVPTVEGPARDFSASDAEMRLTQPRLTLNGIEQSTTPQSQPGLPGLSSNLVIRNVTGSLVWFYLPGRGRYILSLAARPDLDFKRAGELRGGLIKFILDGDTLALECPVEIANGHAPYNLYVLRDPLWEPTAQTQKGKFAVGSVGVEELVLLKRR
jgi:hypothetical protein